MSSPTFEEWKNTLPDSFHDFSSKSSLAAEAVWNARQSEIDALTAERDSARLLVAGAFKAAAEIVAPHDLHNHPFEHQRVLCLQCKRAKEILALTPADAQRAWDVALLEASIEEANKWDKVHRFEPSTDPVTWRINRKAGLERQLSERMAKP